MAKQPDLLDLNEDSRSVTVKYMRITQPIGDFFLAAIDSRRLCEIAYFDVRRVMQDQRDVERYLGIQREVNNRRVQDLEKYVRFSDATFPTSIILAVHGQCATYDEEKHKS